MPAQAIEWLKAQPNLRALRVAAADLNGVARGKRLPVQAAAKLFSDGARFPYSALNLDIRGEDIADSPLVFATGDRDAMLRPTERGLLAMPWLDAPAALLPLWMFHEDGRPYEGDPRQALARVAERYAAKGLTPVVATELEFYLIDDSGVAPRPPASPRSGLRRETVDILSIRALDAFDGFFNDLYDACGAMNIPADAAISEAGPGQFEINLLHQSDLLKAADDAWLFKMLVKGLARKHGFAASFMAKPYPEASGNGMHVHASVLDAAGQNIFDDGGMRGSPALRHAIGGCLAAMQGLAAFFAPHPNSYQRLVDGAHAPTGLCWGYENRTVAIRVPGGAPQARRFEHRMAGGDVNPYLLLAAIMGAAFEGLEGAIEPPEPLTGNAYARDIPRIAGSLETALDLLESSRQAAQIFPSELISNFALTKRQEAAAVRGLSAEAEQALYLDAV